MVAVPINSLSYLEIKLVPWSHPDAVSLRAALLEDLIQIYNMPDLRMDDTGKAPSEADITAFFVAYLTNNTSPSSRNPVGCAGLRALPATETAGDAEIKRMFVAEGARGPPLGVARALLAEMEDWAVREKGWKRLVLGTGTLQHDAIRFYEGRGYHEFEGFGSCIGKVWRCFGKDIGEGQGT